MGFLSDDWVRLASSVLDLDGVAPCEQVQVTSLVPGFQEAHIVVSTVKTVSVNSTFLEGIFIRREQKQS